jgi:hypothetical protein
MKRWEEAKTNKAKLKLLFAWIKENDNSRHEEIGDTQKMTPKELVEVYGSQIRLGVTEEKP